MPDSDILLALDQSSRCTGYSVWKDGVLIDFGHFETTANDIGDRLDEFLQKLHRLVQEYQINRIAFEEIQYQANIGNNVATFKILAYVQAIIITFCTQSHIPYEIISPSAWRSKCGVKGRKREEQKQNAKIWVKEKFDKDSTTDEADSICLGFSALFSTYS